MLFDLDDESSSPAPRQLVARPRSQRATFRQRMASPRMLLQPLAGEALGCQDEEYLDAGVWRCRPV